MATFTTYDARGNKEDFVNAIYDISPLDKPFMTMCKKTKATGVLHNWQQDSLAAAAANARVQGAAAPASAEVPTEIKNNHTQIFANTASVSGTQNAVEHWGRANEFKYQLSKKIDELGRDVEFAFVGGDLQTGTAGNNTTAAELECAQKQISAATTVDAGGAAFSEDDLLAVLEKVYVEGGAPDMLFIAPGHAATIAGFSGNAAGAVRGRERLVEGTRLVNSIDVYQSPYGTVDVVMDRFMDTTSALVVDPEYWALPTLRPTFQIPLAKTGDFIAAENVNECTLACLSDVASGLIENLV